MFSIGEPNLVLLSKIKRYKKRAVELKALLYADPNKWGKFQSEFNQEINGIFRDIMLFEKENIARGNEEKLYKLKRFFVSKLRKDFVYGQYIKWSVDKPFGYAGDFQIIDDIYLNNPTSVGFDRLFDNYFQISAASVATRNRKDDFKRIISKFINERKVNGEKINIMDLASGPCRDIKELIDQVQFSKENIHIDCLDNDENAIAYAKKLLGDLSNISFVKQNVVRMALKKDIVHEFPKPYDLIFSTGLFDYLDEKISVRLVSNLKKLLRPNGVLIIANYFDKYSNPAIHFMEWVGEWNLVYRTEDEFKKIFLDSGFKLADLSIEYEQQGVIQYCFAKNGT